MTSPYIFGTEDIEAELLMVGSCSRTYRLNDIVIKTVRTDDEPGPVQANVEAMRVEAIVYHILGAHDRIATCLYASPMNDLILLPYYENGNLKAHITLHGPTHLHEWAKQMIEAVAFIHCRRVRHSNLRLKQWLLDSRMGARLSGFNSSGHDEQRRLDLGSSGAFGYEICSHFMPRSPDEDSSDRSDVFGLRSALYELEHGSSPYASASDEMVAEHYARGLFPSVSHLGMGSIIASAWRGEFESASEMLSAGEASCYL